MALDTLEDSSVTLRAARRRCSTQNQIREPSISEEAQVVPDLHNAVQIAGNFPWRNHVHSIKPEDRL